MRINKTILIMMGAALIIHGCGSQAPTEDSKKTAAATVSTLQPEKVAKTYTFSGTVSSVKKSTLSTRIMGQIQRVLVHEGDKVKKGQLLVELKSNDIVAQKSQIEANIAAAQAGLNNAETDYHRIQKLYDNKSATQKELDDISTHYLMAKAQLAAAEEARNQVETNLEYALIKAPYDGVITDRFVDGGDMANPGMPLVAIESPEKFEVITRIPESEVSLLERADSVTVRFNTSEDAVKGYIARISPSSRFSGSQFEARIILEPTGRQQALIRSGIYAKVELAKGSEEKILVPSQLLIHRGQLTGVWTVGTSGQALLRWVQPGSEYDSQTEIVAGLSAGDRLIVECESRLYDGLPLSLN